MRVKKKKHPFINWCITQLNLGTLCGVVTLPGTQMSSKQVSQRYIHKPLNDHYTDLTKERY